MQVREFLERIALARPEAELRFDLVTPDGKDVYEGELRTIGITSDELIFTVDVP